MANGSGSQNGGNGGSQSGEYGTIDGGDGIIRVDPGAIDNSPEGTVSATATANGRGPNGRKLNNDGSERKQRTRKSGNATGAAIQKAEISVEALSFSIVGIHALLAASLKVPELALDPKEGEQLAIALKNLQRFYPVAVTEKALAWTNMITALATVYGTRVAAYGARKTVERRNQPSATVIRPKEFQQPRATMQAPARPVQTPDGDVMPGTPQTAEPKASNNADQQFQATPPELM